MDFMKISPASNFTVFTLFIGFSTRQEKLFQIEKNDLSKIPTNEVSDL